MKKESLDFALKLKQKTLDLLNSMDSKVGEFDLPETPETYKNIVIELKENVFRAAVLGEAKRGKSSFINALLGKSILPVEEEIATSKAFLISNAETKSFFIRFMDESCEEIKEEEINLVGSQKEENEGEAINFFDGKNIKWIEINLTYKNLPKYITLIDTPGLGALYPKHAIITYNAISGVDAFIFVLDSDRPVLEPEIEIIKKILKIKPYIFFIQTKIDKYEEWEKIMNRNEEILNKVLFEYYPEGIKIFPISNTNLLMASETSQHEGIFLQLSRFGELKTYLELFVFEVFGYAQIVAGIAEAEEYHKLCANNLNSRMLSLHGQSNSEIQNSIRRLEAELKSIAKKWDTDGIERVRLSKNFNKELKGHIPLFRQMFDMNGNTYEKFSKKILNSKNPKELKGIAERLPEGISGSLQEDLLEFNGKIEAFLKDKLSELILDSDLLTTFINLADDVNRVSSKTAQVDLESLKAQIDKIVKHQPAKNSVKILNVIRNFLAEGISYIMSPIFKVRSWFEKILRVSDTLSRDQETLLSKVRNLLGDMKTSCIKIEEVVKGESVTFEARYFNNYFDIYDTFIETKYREKKANLEKEIKQHQLILDAEIETRKQSLKEIETKIKIWNSFTEELNALKNNLKKTK